VSETLWDTIIASAMEQALAIEIDCPARLRSSAMDVPSNGRKRDLDLVTPVDGRVMSQATEPRAIWTMKRSKMLVSLWNTWIMMSDHGHDTMATLPLMSAHWT
jgi:hypothetical protein